MFLIVKSPAYVQIGEEKFTIKTNSAVIIRPDVPYQYSGIDGEYKNDWLYFESTDADFEKIWTAYESPDSWFRSIRVSIHREPIILMPQNCRNYD